MRLAALLILTLSLNGQQSRDSLALLSLLREDSSLISITPVRVNSSYADYSPVIADGKLFFVSARPSKTGVVYADAENKTQITDLYEAELKTPTRLSAPKPLAVNTKYYEGPFCFNPSGDTLYLTGNDGRSNKLKIMMTAKKGDRWTKPTALNFCSDSFSYCHPSLASGGRLYFSSNHRTGGHMDLFVTDFSEGAWGEPKNLGERINSASNEIFPFAGRKGHLYFSSNRPGGVGGLDLYHTLTGTEDVPRLLHPPINSKEDDFGIYTDSTGQTGYISSGRNKARADDIYYFERSMPDFSGSGEPPVRKKFCYTFYEATTANASDTTILYYEWSFGDGARARGLSTRHCYTATGTFAVELYVAEKSSGKIDTSLVRYEIRIPEQENLHVIAPDSAVINELVVLDASTSAIKDHDIEEIYWSFGDGFYNRGPLVGHRYRTEGKYVVELWVTARHRQSGAEQKYKTSRHVTVRAIN